MRKVGKFFVTSTSSNAKVDSITNELLERDCDANQEWHTLMGSDQLEEGLPMQSWDIYSHQLSSLIGSLLSIHGGYRRALTSPHSSKEDIESIISVKAHKC